MSHPRFFLAAPWSEGELPLTDTDAHHLVSVLRATPGDEIVAVHADGRQSVVRLESVHAAGATASLVDEVPAPWMPSVVLVQAIAKNPRMDVAVEKATEVGVEAIVPLACERSVVQLKGAKATERRERWQRVAEAAAKQARRTSVPRVLEIIDAKGLPSELTDVAFLLVADEGADVPGIGEALATLDACSTDRVAVVVGPEGGLTDDEKAALGAAGGVPASLGATILRTETAGTIAAALVIYELGGLGGLARG